MAKWRDAAEISGDVVFFNYVDSDKGRKAEEIFIWDLDKTYLDTRWGSLKELLRTAFEGGYQKKNIPGTRSLLQALRLSWLQSRGVDYFPVYFITASPPQIEKKINQKLSLDGIQPFGCFFKDNLQNLRPKRLWRLTNQVGYKLQALLQLRCQLREDVRQIFWGDDSESDAIIYNLYSDICSRRLDDHELRRILKSLHVVGEQTESILKLREKIPEQDPVKKIYINLAVDTDPDYYLKFGRRTLPTSNSFQAAVDLFQDKRLGVEQVIRVAQDMRMNYGFTNEEIERSFDELVRRQVLSRLTTDELIPDLQKEGFLPPDYEPSVKPLEDVHEDGDEIFEPWVPERIDYLHDYR